MLVSFCFSSIVLSQTQFTSSGYFQFNTTNYGYMKIGTGPISEYYFNTDKNYYRFDKPVYATNGFHSYNGNLTLGAASGYYVEIKPQSSSYGLIVRENGSSDYGNIEVTSSGLGLGYMTAGSHMLINSSGNVGIGTTAPTSKLEVAGMIYSTTGGIKLPDGTILDDASDLGAGGGDSYWDTATGGIKYMDGNVGIGIDSPQELLHINGSVRGNQSGALRISSGNGYIDVGARNTGWAHFVTDRPSFYFNTEIRVASGLIGSYNNDLSLRAAGSTIMTLTTGGNVGIGCQNPQTALSVNGTITAKRIDVVEDVPCSDYVFNSDYKLLSLTELNEFIKANKHLPEVPSAEEFQENGYSVGEMDDLLLRKIEELSLYIIDLEKRIAELEKNK